MKAAILGDLHLGAGPDYGAAPGDRLADQRECWAAACRIAAERADFAVFLGDAFHKPRATPSEISAFQDGVAALDGMPLIAVAGNHDVTTATEPTAMEVALRDVSSAHVHRVPKRLEVDMRPRLDAEDAYWEVCVLPWTSPSGIAALVDHDGRDDLHAIVVEALLDAARALRAECETSHPILCLHWSVSGAATGTGARTDDFREPVLPWQELDSMGWHAVCCGHIHSPQMIGHPHARTPIFYAGSLQTVDFGEADSRHQVWIVDTEKWAATTLVPVEDRPFVTLDSVVDGAQLEPVRSQPVTGAVVRVRVHCSEAEYRQLDQSLVRQALLAQGAYRVYQILPVIEREERSRAAVDETAEPLVALDEWIRAVGDVPDADGLRSLTTSYLEAV